MADREGAVSITATTETASSASSFIIVVHPLVLLSTVDHYNRVAKDTKKRVVGGLLGTGGVSGGTLDITNSFAVPFEEDLKNPAIWYLDHNYLETMFRMYKKVNARERILGFYSTGPKIKENDIKARAPRAEPRARVCPRRAVVALFLTARASPPRAVRADRRAHAQTLRQPRVRDHRRPTGCLDDPQGNHQHGRRGESRGERRAAWRADGGVGQNNFSTQLKEAFS